MMIRNILVLFILLFVPLRGQTICYLEDPCGYDPEHAAAMLKLFGTGWGYTYDSLLTDLSGWGKNPFVTVDSAGASVQNRGIWLVTIKDTSLHETPPLRITIHSRTHPNEVQATWVTNAIIDELLGESDLARTLRKNCEFNIVPMYNPDGVEMEYGRENANGVDLERDWISTEQPETATLKELFETYMASDSPIRIALNMHSAYACKRYFVYHHENGTSEAYAEAEQFFITSIQEKWPEGIEPWNYYISWIDGTPTYYPESWFWLNYQEAVMALTYEDMNCAEAGDYGRTAKALLDGITDFLGIRETAMPQQLPVPGHSEMISDLTTFPNPIATGSTTHIRFTLRQPVPITIRLYDLLGRKIADFGQIRGVAGAQISAIDLPQMAQGLYFLQISGPQIQKSVPIILVH